VLCGSRKYPIKEPFVELMKGSLNTFLNAFTYPDRTCYPVASTNAQVRLCGCGGMGVCCVCVKVCVCVFVCLEGGQAVPRQPVLPAPHGAAQDPRAPANRAAR
jgi:hypothetical protein